MSEHRDRESLRKAFGSVAGSYDRVRPGYPAGVYDGLAGLVRLEPGSRVLEIGPGTGQATSELVRRGYAVTAVELSPQLAEVARRNAPEAETVFAEIGTWEMRQGGFDGALTLPWIAPRGLAREAA